MIIAEKTKITSLHMNLYDMYNYLKVKGNAIGSCCHLNEIGTETNHKFNVLCVSEALIGVVLIIEVK
jgi:hypothetical protein